MSPVSIRTESAQYDVHVNVADPAMPYTIFLHGPGFNSAAEREILGSRLGSQLNLLWFDLLGGHGAPAHGPDRITWAGLLDDIFRIVGEFTPGPVNVVGHCLGAHLTHDLVRARPGFVRRAVWFSPVNSVTDTLKGVLCRGIVEGRLELSALSEQERSGIIRFMACPPDAMRPEDALFVLGMSAKLRDFHAMYWTDMAAMQAWAGRLEEFPFSPDAFLGLQGDFFGQRRDLLPLPSYDGIPVLMLHSAEDRITPWELNGRLLLNHIRHAEEREIPGGSHWLQFQKADDCASHTLRFLRG